MTNTPVGKSGIRTSADDPKGRTYTFPTERHAAKGKPLAIPVGVAVGCAARLIGFGRCPPSFLPQCLFAPLATVSDLVARSSAERETRRGA